MSEEAAQELKARGFGLMKERHRNANNCSETLKKVDRLDKLMLIIQEKGKAAEYS